MNKRKLCKVNTQIRKKKYNELFLTYNDLILLELFFNLFLNGNVPLNY